MEFPHLQKLLQKYGAQILEVVTINDKAEDEARAQLLMSKQRFGFTNLQAPEMGWSGKQYGVRGFPTTFLLDSDGNAVFMHVGFGPDAEEQMDREIAALLARSALVKGDMHKGVANHVPEIAIRGTTAR